MRAAPAYRTRCLSNNMIDLGVYADQRVRPLMVPRKGLPTFLTNISKNRHLDRTLRQRLYHRPVPPSRLKSSVSRAAGHPPTPILRCNG